MSIGEVPINYIDGEPYKDCTGCGVNKPLTEFWVDRTRGTGRLSRCRACMLVERQARNVKYRKRNMKIATDELEMLKLKAYSLVKSERRAGRIVSEPCFLCGDLRVHAHHLNYRYPLKLIYLCNKHHREVHNDPN